MSIRCSLGKHNFQGGQVRFTEPLKSGKFDISRMVELRQYCSRCSKVNILPGILLVDQPFNLLPRKELSDDIEYRIEELYKMGNTNKDIASILNISLSTVKRRLKLLTI